MKTTDQVGGDNVSTKYLVIIKDIEIMAGMEVYLNIFDNGKYHANVTCIGQGC